MQNKLFTKSLFVDILKDTGQRMAAYDTSEE